MVRAIAPRRGLRPSLAEVPPAGPCARDAYTRVMSTDGTTDIGDDLKITVVSDYI